MSSFPFYRQLDSMQCGIACLQMICSYYGSRYTSAELSAYCYATTEGISLLSIKNAASSIGFDSSCLLTSINGLMNLKQPCIIHWDQNHFVVLYKVDRRMRKFYIADPAKGLLCCKRDEFVTHWCSNGISEESEGIVMYLQPNKDFEVRTYNSTKTIDAFAFLLAYIKQYKIYFGQILLGLLVGCLVQLIFPFLTQTIVDVGIAGKKMDLIWLILIGQLILTISKYAIEFIRRWLLLYVSMRVNISLVSDFFIKLLKLPMCFFDTKLTGDILQRISDHGRVEKFLTNQVLNVMFSILGFLIFGIILFVYDKVIFSIFLIGSLVYGLWIIIFFDKRKVLDYELFAKQARNTNCTYQFIRTMQEIKLQDCENRRRWEWEDIQTDLFNVQMESLKLQQAQEAGSLLINEIKNIVITVVSATAVIRGDMTLGMMMSVQYIIGQLNSPVEQLMNFLQSIQEVKISLERINEIHTSTQNEDDGRKVMSLDHKDNNISFNQVSFKYDPHSSKYILKDATITLPEGKVTAIVGASGSGKTTLIKLMLGYYKQQTGTIYIGENNIDDVNLRWWRRQCGVVMQEGVIFSDSIARNIAVDDDDVNHERLMFASEVANIKDFILGLPLKYDTKIGQDGVGLSQGQKQRILIARAVYKDPKYIFLDEATNSLDANNEKVIVENLSRFYKGRTVIVVAHRLSTVKNADQIIVVDAGKIVEIGNHDSLTRKRGTYYNLVKNQLELGN